jgi:hypothetical protein
MNCLAENIIVGTVNKEKTLNIDAEENGILFRNY